MTTFAIPLTRVYINTENTFSSLIQLLASDVYTTIMVTNEIALSHVYSLQRTSVNRRKVLPFEPTKTVTYTTEQFNVYVHRNEAYFIYIYV